MKALVNQCFSNIGVILDVDQENFLLDEYIENSITYISLLVELEQCFDIEIPDDYLEQGRLQTFYDICNMVEQLQSEVL